MMTKKPRHAPRKTHTRQTKKPVVRFVHTIPGNHMPTTGSVTTYCEQTFNVADLEDIPGATLIECPVCAAIEITINAAAHWEQGRLL